MLRRGRRIPTVPPWLLNFLLNANSSLSLLIAGFYWAIIFPSFSQESKRSYLVGTIVDILDTQFAQSFLLLCP